MSGDQPAPAAGAEGGGALTIQPGKLAMLSGIYSRLKEYGGTMFANRKPWGEVLDRTSFARPANLAEASARLRKNASYFKINYLIVLLASVAVGFFTHPSSLIVLGVLAAGWVYVFAVRTGPLVVSGREISDREKVTYMSVGSFVVIFFLTNVASVVFSALMMGAALVAVHGATRVPDDLFLDDTDAGQSLLGIFTGGAKQPAGIGNV